MFTFTVYYKDYLRDLYEWVLKQLESLGKEKIPTFLHTYSGSSPRQKYSQTAILEQFSFKMVTVGSSRSGKLIVFII